MDRRPIIIISNVVSFALLVTLLGLAVWLSQQLTADEIIRRAMAVVTSSDVQNFSVVLPFSEAYGAERKIWYQAPNKWRMEYINPNEASSNSNLSQLTSVAVADGKHTWDYEVRDKLVSVDDHNLILGSDAHANLTKILQGTNLTLYPNTGPYPCEDKVRQSDATVAGRKVYVISTKTSKRCGPQTADSVYSEQTFWIDQQSYFVLKQEGHIHYPEEAGTENFTREVAEFEYNIPIDPSIFTFAIPPGVTVDDYGIKPAPSAAEFQQGVTELARQLDYPFYQPTYVPSGLAPRYPKNISKFGPALEYVRPDKAETDTWARTVGIEIWQTKATYDVIRTSASFGQLPYIGSKDVIIAGTSTGNPPDATVLLMLGGTWITMYSDIVSADELIKVAHSLEPAPGSHQPVPNPTPPTLDSLRKQAPFPVFVPSYIPTNLVAEPPLYDKNARPLGVIIDYYDQQGNLVLGVDIRDSECCIDLPGFQPVTLSNGLTALVGSYIPGGLLDLFVGEGNVTVSLQTYSSQISKDELLKIAASLSRTAPIGRVVVPYSHQLP